MLKQEWKVQKQPDQCLWTLYFYPLTVFFTVKSFISILHSVHPSWAWFFLVELKKIYETSAFCKRCGNIIPFQQRGFMCFPYLLHYGKTNFHSLCENCNHLCSCFTVPIAAIIDISHSLRKYIVVKKCTYILLNILQAEREENYSLIC